MLVHPSLGKKTSAESDSPIYICINNNPPPPSPPYHCTPAPLPPPKKKEFLKVEVFENLNCADQNKS